ncbi:Kiwa anti-phage protein KwaB-like domain-containing protein [uncultured Sphingomonas sp.]|uniref:Kiwa anti-phage protein KwaB-like domain-containing protein n=1 Tax=uncultured Sphingomonas sp. TaxID=158754 RepID=UPI0025EA0D90|nr:Kiwa anti-phage protein KwaB-like domain-containing protein [uncultured Sphingomonas sp.]
MINDEFNTGDIASVDFCATLKHGERFFIPTDGGVQDALKTILGDTVSGFDAIEGDWELHDISEDYGERRRVYAPRNLPLFETMSEIYDSGALPELPDLQNHLAELDYYFAKFVDSEGRTMVGVKKARTAKATLGAQNKLVRLIDNTLVLIEERVLRLDRQFDVLISADNVFILEPRATEQVAKIVERVASSAAAKVQEIHDAVPFLDLSRIKVKIARHPKLARIAHSIASNPNLHDIQRAVIEDLAAAQSIRFKELNGRLLCNVADEAKLMEVLDARRYHLDLTATGAIPYRATARQVVRT